MTVFREVLAPLWKRRGDLKGIGKRTENMIRTVAKEVTGSAIVTYQDGYDKIDIYVTPQARYLIREEGADAEIRATKPVKGKIFRDENDDFYFVVGTDKDSNTLEVDFTTIIPGVSVKILSK